MATRYWLGTATAAAQVSEAGINVFDATTTYGITINGETVSVAGITDEQTTTDNLVTALNNSTLPYFTQITWDRNGTGASSTVRGTADVAGMPFTFTTYANAGTGSWNAVSDTTANSGPNDWSTAANWSGSTVPVSTDDVVISDSAVNICWGLDQNAVTLTSLTITKTFTGRIGLDYKKFATSADGATVISTKAEYRENYLKISATNVDIGEHYGAGSPAGSTRILLDLGSNQSTIVVHDTASTSAETGRNAVRLLNTHASSTLNIRSSVGGVGVAAEEPGETSTFSAIRSDTNSANTNIEIGAGVTVTTYYQKNGTVTLQAAATVTTVTVESGTLTTEGDYTITTFNMNGGTVNQNHVKGGGSCITTLNLNGGRMDTTKNGASRTITTMNLSETGGIFIGNGSNITITTINEPSNPYTLTMSGT